MVLANFNIYGNLELKCLVSSAPNFKFLDKNQKLKIRHLLMVNRGLTNIGGFTVIQLHKHRSN